MKVALFSPLNPVKSGISDYTEELLPELAKFLDLDIYIDPGYTPSAPDFMETYRIIPFDADRFEAAQYDAILYHMGNYFDAHRYIYECMKRHRGVVVLHDYVMQGFYAERYLETGDFLEYQTLLEKHYGERGSEIARSTREKRPGPIWESPEALQFPLCEELLEYAGGVVVHSEFVRRNILGKTEVPVTVIPHHGHDLQEFDVPSIRRDLGVGEHDILICAAGYVGRNKRYDQILAALQALKKDVDKIRFIIAGEDRGSLLTGASKDTSVEFRVLGHLPLKAMEGIICASDICINLRYPTMGESSGVLTRMMGYGKPVLVTDIGSYAELPEYTVLKVAPNIDEIETIKRFIDALAKDREFRLAVGREARLYVEQESSMEKCVRRYVDFLHEVSGKPEVRPA
jgi:glycosyltransferase involved in cell wall biosynthesis